jgi:branched-subunit amino acid ABC-type transport system permease component
VLTALDVGIGTESGMSALLAASVSLVVGGVGTFAGAVLGALVLGMLQTVVTWTVSAHWTDAVTFALLVLMLSLRPEGLCGVRRRVEEAVR